MTNDKYRVHEVAKDLNVPSKDIIDLLGKHFDTPKKHMTALTSEELNLVFEHYTQNNQEKSFDEYFASGQKKEAAKPEQPKQEKAEKQAPKQPKQEQKAAPKREETPAKFEKEAQREVTMEKKPAQQASAPKADAPKQKANFTPNTNKKFNSDNRQGGQQERRQGGQNQQRPNNNNGFRQNNNQQPKAAPAQQNRPNNAPAAKKPAAQPAAPARPVTPVAPPPTETTASGRTFRHVDMRAANVDLDKYNERYETIAPVNMARKDTGVKKQKFANKNNKKPFMSKKDKEMEKLRRLEMERERRQKLQITIPDEITVGDLALRLKVQAAEVIKKLMMLGVMASVSEVIDYDTAAMVAMEIGAKVEREVVVTLEERLFDDTEDNDDNLVARPPVVVVMGHVDHGKTSILDAIRKANVTSGEAGGITQHIGAYQVAVGDRPITFLDTPGHEAFTSMRARGAKTTDIAILVVAADDGIMPQTVESIAHAKAAEVSIIVAINKIDKPTADIERVKQELTEYELVPEEWGGDVICVPVSAKTGQGLDELLEMVLLTADVKELKANPDRQAKGTVIEARLDKGRGPIATLLVQTGTLRTGDAIIAGTAVGRVRVMCNDRGERLDVAGPSTPVEITGLAEVPSAGDIFNAVEDERLARELVEQRKTEAKEEQFKSYNKVTLENLFSQIADGEMKELPIIVKADVQGSAEAVKQSLEKLTNEEVRVKVIHSGVGTISKSDVMLANASNAIIVGFNVRPDTIVKEEAEREGVDIRLYRIIYDAINEITDAMKGMLAPKFRDVELGKAEIRQVYKISGVGMVAGAYVTEGKITRNAKIRVVRDGIIVADVELNDLKRFKDSVKEVARGFECGMSLVKYADIKEGDIFEAYITEEYRD
ncbi:MAG: translation initiation factor IF-2 [Oscillospiraceae bacterium]|nr:translation initiation factor IF-2 [Oscillospiraceae bacterium]